MLQNRLLSFIQFYCNRLHCVKQNRPLLYKVTCHRLSKKVCSPLGPLCEGARPQAVGERTVRLPEIFRAMARFSPSAPSGHRSPSGASATSPRIGGVCLAEGGQTVKKAHCRGEHCSPVPVCLVRKLFRKMRCCGKLTGDQWSPLHILGNRPLLYKVTCREVIFLWLRLL